MDTARVPVGPRPIDVLESAARKMLVDVPADVWCAVQLDPSTMLDTGGFHANGFPAESMQRLFEIEHVEQDDLDNIRALRTRGVSASLLSRTARGDLTTSKYYRDVLRPLGLADELRVLLRDGSRVWGLLVLCRAEGAPPFTVADVSQGIAISQGASDPLRRSFLTSGRDRPDLPDAPGLLILDADLRLSWASAGADRWLAWIAEPGWDARGQYPYTVRALATKSRSVPEGAGVRTRVADSRGGWLALHAWTTQRGSEVQTAVSIGPADGSDLLAVILDAFGLTPRERDVAQQVILGRSTEDAARVLKVSQYTFQDHLKAVFRKTGVNSRGQLAAKLFFEHYLPRITAPPLSMDGRLIED